MNNIFFRNLAQVPLPRIKIADLTKFFDKIHTRKDSIPLYDGTILKLHYRWTFIIMFCGFLTVTQQWFHEKIMICRHLSDVKVKHDALDPDHMNICLSYPYVEEHGRRRYILYYRWIPWAFLLLTAVYYIPRLVSKKYTNTLSRELNVVLINAKLDGFNTQEVLWKAVAYMEENRGTHNGIYWKYLILNCLALVVDAFTMFFWDILLQGRFIQYGMTDLYYRNPEDFSDEISRTFPPFVKCSMEKVHMLTSQDEKAYGCHLTIMELYEKVFLILWFWLVLLIIITTIYIIYLICIGLLFTPCVSICWQETKETDSDTVGDYYIRFRLKSHVSEAKCKHLFKYHFRNKPWISGIRSAK
ncbi:unnamed protein product, partial [Meganyctiphanes norvegica]